MAWATIFENEQFTVVVDDEKNSIMVEMSSGGYRPRFVTAHWSAEEAQAVIDALRQAVAALQKDDSPL